MNDPELKIIGFSNYELRHELYTITLLITYVLTGKLNWSKIKDPIVLEFMHKGTHVDIEKRFQTLDELSAAARKCIKELEERS